MKLNQNTLVVYVTFNPNIELLKNSILKSLQFFTNILIVDNNSLNLNQIYQLTLTKAFIISNNSNIGLSKALNNAFSYAKNKGFNFVLILDQDSIIPDNLLSEYESASNKSPESIFFPTIIDRKIRFNSSKTKIPFKIKPINSGSLIKISIWDKLNRFDENLFIDGIDHDFFLRANKSNINLLNVANVILSHQIGDAREFLFLKSIRFVVYNHTVFRKYHIAYSIIYLAKKHGNTLTLFIGIFRILKQLLLVLFFERNKIDKIRSILKGFIHGFSNNINV